MTTTANRKRMTDGEPSTSPELARRMRKLADEEGTDALRKRLGIGQSTLYYLLRGVPPKQRAVLRRLDEGGVQVPKAALLLR